MTLAEAYNTELSDNRGRQICKRLKLAYSYTGKRGVLVWKSTHQLRRVPHAGRGKIGKYGDACLFNQDSPDAYISINGHCRSYRSTSGDDATDNRGRQISPAMRRRSHEIVSMMRSQQKRTCKPESLDSLPDLTVSISNQRLAGLVTPESRLFYRQ